jgi:hypothetical protein
MRNWKSTDYNETLKRLFKLYDDHQSRRQNKIADYLASTSVRLVDLSLSLSLHPTPIFAVDKIRQFVDDGTSVEGRLVEVLATKFPEWYRDQFIESLEAIEGNEKSRFDSTSWIGPPLIAHPQSGPKAATPKPEIALNKDYLSDQHREQVLDAFAAFWKRMQEKSKLKNRQQQRIYSILKSFNNAGVAELLDKSADPRRPAKTGRHPYQEITAALFKWSEDN